MSMTYQQIINTAQVSLRDKQGANWDATTDLLPLLEIIVQVMRTIMGNTNPEMIWVETTITLDSTTGYGPYYIGGIAPIDFKSIARMESDQHSTVERGSREKSKHNTSNGRPDEYWLEGFNNTKIYFNRGIPAGSSYVYHVWYIPIVSRAVVIGDTLAMPDYFYETLVFWLVKLAGNMDEYITESEDSLLTAFTPVVSSILDSRAGELQVEVDKLGF